MPMLISRLIVVLLFLVLGWNQIRMSLNLTLFKFSSPCVFGEEIRTLDRSIRSRYLLV